jgi:hypothetical protein
VHGFVISLAWNKFDFHPTTRGLKNYI